MKRIAITGPESSGKTTLAASLAAHYGVKLIPEFARIYLEEHGSEYEQSDLDKIGMGHLEGLVLSQDSIKITDTDFVVLKVWSDYKYNFTSTYINTLVSENHFDLHIVCSPDIPWEFDPLRENPENRHELFENYIRVLRQYKKDFIIVSGDHDKRLKRSLAAIDAL